MPLRLTCGVCGKVSSKRDHHARHVRTHTHERPFICLKCGRDFARADTLSRHKRSQHQEDDTLSGEQDTIGDHQVGAQATSTNDSNLDLPDSLLHHTISSSSFDLQSPQGQAQATLLSPDYWHWDSTFELNPDFDIATLGTFDINNACPSMPWLPLRQGPSRHATPPVTAGEAGSPTSPWFTRMHHPETRSPARVQTFDTTSTDLSRDTLAISLQHKTSAALLPPTSFLNRALHTFTTKLWHLVPVVHLPTFVPARAHPLLLLSICSLGALAEGTPEAIDHAIWLYEGVQKAILVSWNADDIYDPAVLALLQAATIGQTFAILSPKPAHLRTARAFHGTLCTAIEDFRALISGLQQDLPDTAYQQWQRWITAQTCIRLTHVVQCHDGELAATFQKRSILRWPASEIIVAAADQAFLAASVDDWARAKGRAEHEQHPFSSCAFLESLLAEILDARSGRLETMPSELSRIQNMLLDWNDGFAVTSMSDTWRITLSFLMHSCFIQLHCDLDQIERHFGRDGYQTTASDYVKAWSADPQAKKCIIHAIGIAELAAQLRLGDMAAMHIARSMFSAALVLAAFSLCAPPNSIIDNAAYASRFPSPPAASSRIPSGQHSSSVDRCKMLAFSIAGSLRSLRPWPNAERYAKTLAPICARLEA